MKYSKYAVEDFIKDEYFQKWILNSDSMTDGFWENWLIDFPNKKEQVEKAKRLLLLMSFDTDELPKKDFDLMWRNIIEKRTDTKKELQLRVKKKFRNALRVAIVVVAAITMGLGFYLKAYLGSPEVEIVENETLITLQLEDGTVKILDENSSQVLINTSGDSITHQEKNRLEYNGNESDNRSLSYNVLTIPYGKKFVIALSDGSEIFLNSGSKIRYPVKFIKGAPRNVYLDGEAFFIVATDTLRPFTVITDDMNTKVYGTEFNVSCYKNENNTSMVLVNGSVGVYKANNGEAGEPVPVSPGHRAIFIDNNITTEKVAVAKYIAWREGKLVFIEDRFDVISKELERHFNVAIENDYADLNQRKFTGTFEKESLVKILRIFQEHTPFDFTIKDDQVTLVAKK